MDVIADELRKNNVNIDVTTLSSHIHYILYNYRDAYNESASRLNKAELPNVFNEMNVNSFGRAMAYLALVYRMNYYYLIIPEEDTVREAVRLAVPVLRNNARVEGDFIRSGAGYVLNLWDA